MDEQFPLFFNEVDWLYRIRSAGWQIWFTPSARVKHYLGASTRQVPLRAAWLSHTGLHAFYRKHYRSRLHLITYTLIVVTVYLHAFAVLAVRGAQQIRDALS
jgi:GT2 family glycosyltransferase